jgi:hypothetical protein
MKYLILITLSMAALFLEYCSYPNPNQLKSGAYLSKRYIKLLTDSRSPEIAQNDSIAGADFYREIARDSNSNASILLGDIHSAVGYFEIGSNGKVIFPKEMGYRPDLTVFIIDSSKFKLTYEDGSSTEYVFVGKESRWAATLLFKGEYSDVKNNRYVFSDSIFSKPNGEQFHYNVPLDCWGGPPICDCLYLNDQPYHFNISSDTLKVFEYYGDSYSEISKQPKWVLVRVDK